MSNRIFAPKVIFNIYYCMTREVTARGPSEFRASPHYHPEPSPTPKQQYRAVTYRCRDCEREFAPDEYGGSKATAAQARDQHERTAHRSFPRSAASTAKIVCPSCAKQFPFAKYKDVQTAERAWAQHQRSAHTSGNSEGEYDSSDDDEQNMPDPPVPSAGQWISYRVFKEQGGKKSFGYYVCVCGKFWVSAHSQVGARQGCQSCEKYSLPKLMWHNLTIAPRRKAADDNKLDAPHDKARCEACQKSREGDCRKSSVFDSDDNLHTDGWSY